MKCASNCFADNAGAYLGTNAECVTACTVDSNFLCDFKIELLF